MRIDQLLSTRTRTLSFEFFPPKSDRAMSTLEDTIQQLVPLGPDFVSVTYGAGGGTRGKTRAIIEHIQKSTGLAAMAHLTCVNATVAELKELLDDYHSAGIDNLLALRGDPPKGQERFVPTDGGCAYALDLIKLISSDGRFSTLCAAFPERHPDASSREADWENLERKFAAGASAAITQCFFEIEPYQEMMAWFAGRQQKPRIIPGILPIVNYPALKRFCAICQATIPESLRAILDPLGDDTVAIRKVGMRFTINLCDQLLRAGAPGLHLYCLNHSAAAAEIVTTLRQLGHDL
jgi:methylenetetrahydrofolate reductase (NADPH)